MFGFKKKEVNVEKVEQFSRWFFENEERIRSSVENRGNDNATMMRVLDEVEAELAKVYRDGYNGTIEFDYGGQDNDWELNLYHKNKTFLVQATTMIAQEMNAKGNSMWKVMIDR